MNHPIQPSPSIVREVHGPDGEVVEVVVLDVDGAEVRTYVAPDDGAR